jgi:oxaloacetate decarboxylase beta subunit
MTDFGPLIANPKTALLGAAAQFGVFAIMLFVSVANFLPGVAFNLKEACAVSIIGGVDGPTTIYVAAKLAPHLLATVAVAAYSYMALVPIIQSPIMRAFTTKKERLIKMRQLRLVSRVEKIFFLVVVFVLTLLLIPTAAHLIGCLMFGNFIREIGVVERLSNVAQNDLWKINAGTPSVRGRKTRQKAHFPISPVNFRDYNSLILWNIRYGGKALG